MSIGSQKVEISFGSNRMTISETRRETGRMCLWSSTIFAKIMFKIHVPPFCWWCSFALFSAPRVPTQDLSIIPLIMGFPGGAVVKNPPADAGDSG